MDTITKKQFDTYVKNQDVAANIKPSYEYELEYGTKMVEFHVDVSKFFQEKDEISNTNGKWEGLLSVRAPHYYKPIMIIGQDENVFHQYTLKKKQWVGAEGQQALLPKSKGAGLMISEFQAREIGMLQNISDIDMVAIYQKRFGTNYIVTEAAIDVNDNAAKPPLPSSPFLVYFEVGANNDRYWGYNNMVLQFEDVIDVVKHLFPEFEFSFLFDHSSGHQKKRTGGGG